MKRPKQQKVESVKASPVEADKKVKFCDESTDDEKNAKLMDKASHRAVRATRQTRRKKKYPPVLVDSNDSEDDEPQPLVDSDSDEGRPYGGGGLTLELQTNSEDGGQKTPFSRWS